MLSKDKSSHDVHHTTYPYTVSYKIKIPYMVLKNSVSVSPSTEVDINVLILDLTQGNGLSRYPDNFANCFSINFCNI